MEKEIWKPIEGYNDLYSVSSLGNIRNNKTNKLLIGSINNIGYRRVAFGSSNKKYFVHRLVAKYFCEGYDDNLVVNHKDGNKLNNKASNLEWVTRSQNDLHAFANGLRKPHIPTFIYKIEKYDLATNKTLKTYNNADECCSDLKVSRSCVYNTCNGIQNSCRGFGLRYYK